MWPAIGGERLELFVTLTIFTLALIDRLEICSHTSTSLSHAGRFSAVTPIPFKSSHTKPDFDFSAVTTLYVLFN